MEDEGRTDVDLVARDPTLPGGLAHLGFVSVHTRRVDVTASRGEHTKTVSLCCYEFGPDRLTDIPLLRLLRMRASRRRFS